MMYYYGSFFPFGFLGPVFMILFWVAIIYGLTILFKKTIVSDDSKHKSRSMEILKERYAKGEITKHEFEAMKKDLE